MCGQHIDRKCDKCGWGLPLLERRRLRGELNEGSPSVAVGVGRHEHHSHEHGHGRVHKHGEAVASREETLGTRQERKPGMPGSEGLCQSGYQGLGAKRSGEEPGGSSSVPAIKRVKVDNLSDSEAESVDGEGKGKAVVKGNGSLSREIRMTRPWKSVYCERLVVERNWRKGRCKMTTLRVSLVQPPVVSSHHPYIPLFSSSVYISTLLPSSC